jgi:NAD(P)-dependent dehydrogenase (short-subunit alcohol dehydrogenase family)
MRQVVFITGISSGFGKGIAVLLASKGYSVYGTSRKETESDANITVLKADVTDAAAIKIAIEKVIKKEGRIDVLINNAGMGISGAIEEFSAEDIKLQMGTNVMGAVNTIQAVLPFMRKRGEGLILNVSSIGGLMGLPFQGFYSASKYAIEGLSEALRMEVKQFNVKIVVIEPGDFATNFTANRKIVSNGTTNSAYKEQFTKTLSIIEKDEKGGLPPSFLAKKVLKIIETKKPCHRYVISTFEQKLAVCLKAVLPNELFFKILASHYGIK